MRVIKITALGLCCLALPLHAQTTAAGNPSVRSLSLQECIRLALAHNLSIQYARYEPAKARSFLSGSYSYYDPVFTANARQTSSETEGRLLTGTTVPLPSSTITEDWVNAGVRGFGPTGLEYSLGFDTRHRQGESGTVNPFFGPYTIPFEEYTAGLSVTLAQPLLKDFWIDDRRATIQIAKQEVKRSEHALTYQVMTTTWEVEQAYYELVAARDNVKVQEKAVELAERLLADNKRKVEVGALAPLDEKQAEAQAASSRADLIAAQAQVAVAENRLKNLITDNYESWHMATVEPTERLLALPETFNLPESWLNGLTLRPDFNARKLELEQQGIRVRLAHNQTFPTLDLVGGYGRAGVDTAITSTNVFPPNSVLERNASFSDALGDITAGRNPNYYIGAQLSIPLENRGARYEYRRQKQLREQLEIQLKQLHQQILVEIDDAVKLAKAAYEAAQATRQATLFAEAALDAEQKKLDNGKSTSFNVLQLQRDLTLARADEIRALAAYIKALATLHYREGTILQKNRIALEIQ